MATFTQTFPDTVVTFKPTPARAKKPKPDIDLGVTPLDTSAHRTLDYNFASTAHQLTKPSATISKPPVGMSTDWEQPAPALNLTTNPESKPRPGWDENQNFQYFTDQYGNAILLQAPVNQVITQSDLASQTNEPLLTQTAPETTSTQTWSC